MLAWTRSSLQIARSPNDNNEFPETIPEETSSIEEEHVVSSKSMTGHSADSEWIRWDFRRIF